jgi:hypothetical protein
MALNTINHWANLRGIKNTQRVAETFAFEGTCASAGWGDNTVWSQIRAYGLAKRIDCKNGVGRKNVWNSSNISCRKLRN